MKAKIKIFGYMEGKRCSIQRTIETPEFEMEDVEFMGHSWSESVLEKQEDWINDNYFEVVVPLAEKAFIYPIEGFKLIVLKTKTKKDEVLELLDKLSEGKSEEWKALVLGTLYELWPSIKSRSAEKIVETVMLSLVATSKITIGYLKGISSVLTKEKKITDHVV